MSTTVGHCDAGARATRWLGLLVTLASCAWLTWSADALVSSAIAPGAAPAAASWRVEALPITEEGVDADRPRVLSVVADDRVAPASPGDAEAIGHSPQVLAEFTAARAAVTVWRAATPRRLTIHRDGQRVRDIALPARRWIWSTSTLALPTDAPPRHAPWRRWTWTIWAAAILGLAAWTRPWCGGRRAMTWCAIHAGVLHLAFWATQPLTAGGDTTAFVGAAVALLEQGRIPDGPPGYPAFLALTLAAVEPFGPAVSLVQVGLAVVVAVSIGRLVSHSFGTPAAIAAAVAVTSAGELLDATRALMAESLLCAAIVAATAAANEHARSGRRRDLALFTVATVGATAIRVVPAASLTMLLAGLHAPRWRASTRRWVAAATLATAVAAASWVVISLHVPGGAGLPARAGAHLYNGVVHGKGLIDADGDTTRRFVAALRDRDGGFVPYWRARDRLRAAKLGDGPIDDVLGRIALEAMLADPGALLVKIVGQLGRQLATVPGMARRSLREAAAVADRPLSERAVLPTTARGVGWKSVTDVLSWKVWSWQLAAAAVAVAWAIARRSTAVLAAGWTVVGTLALHATVEDATARYSSMVAPLVRGIGTAAIVGLLHDILRRVLNARRRAR